ncbi:hypothetical protein [Archangium sp.]|uniref:hypothetical protein n=1 Tax=Archangium sp. TaxID=1872627 RepID=UPI002D500EA0|nr:hypothetical protein [Archangium sp.]HYO58691.1 hypothetical protein [Archangium sp.]
MRLYHLASSCFGSVGAHQGGRLVLSLFFKAVLGVQRIFHFDPLTDVGLALLTGGRYILSRRTLGGLVRAVSTRAVGRFVRLTQPAITSAHRLCVSIDEHVVARFTRKFLIPKGFHTIRNKKMRAEKLFFSFDTAARTLLHLVVTPDNGRLAPVASKMLGALRAQGRRRPVRAVLDAGPHRTIARCSRWPTRTPIKCSWYAPPGARRTSTTGRRCPRSSSRLTTSRGGTRERPAKRIHVAETTTAIRAAKGQPVRQVRTLVAREQKRGGKERWHALFVFGGKASDALSLIKEFRARQHHEQAYRILLHDAFVDTVPSGYNKRSRNPDRPGFRKNAITLYAWLAGLAVNTLTAFSASLPERFKWAHPRTLRRWWLNFPADLYLTDRALFVVLHPRWFRSWWKQKVEQLNAKKLRLPWMDDRLVLYSLKTPLPEGAEPSSAP